MSTLASPSKKLFALNPYSDNRQHNVVGPIAFAAATISSPPAEPLIRSGRLVPRRTTTGLPRRHRLNLRNATRPVWVCSPIKLGAVDVLAGLHVAGRALHDAVAAKRAPGATPAHHPAVVPGRTAAADAGVPALRRLHRAHQARLSTCLVSFQRNRYSVPASFANRPVSVRAYADRVVLVAEG